MWNKTKATEILKIQYPIIQGPFGGRFSSVKLLSTVSNLGGMGSFGLNSYQPDEILEVDQKIKAATRNTYNLNLWVPLNNDPIYDYDHQKHQEWQKVYAEYFKEMHLPVPPMPEVKKPIFEEQLEAVIQAKPPVVSFIFGIPPIEAIRELKRLGTIIIAAATTVEEAQMIDESEIDLIIATGKEAGGHRPSFLKPEEDSLHNTKDLVEAVLKKVKKPVIAAGGVSNGQKAQEYLKMGASAVQLGTAFLATKESGATPDHKQQLLSNDSFTTELSKVYSGRLARTISNKLSNHYLSLKKPIHAPYPIQSQLLSKLMKEYREKKVMDKIPFWAGEPSAILNNDSASELFNHLVQDIQFQNT